MHKTIPKNKEKISASPIVILSFKNLDKNLPKPIRERNANVKTSGNAAKDHATDDKWETQPTNARERASNVNRGGRVVQSAGVEIRKDQVCLYSIG